MKFNKTFTKKMYDDHQKWLKDNKKGKQLDLRGANLPWVDLEYADLTGANLKGAELSYSNLKGADLRRANLNAADLSSANLTHANLEYADLTNTDLHRANLTGAVITNADLSNADLTRAVGVGKDTIEDSKADTVKPTSVSSTVNTILEKVNKLATCNLTVEEYAILMDTVQVAKDVLTTSNYELGTLDVPDPDEIKKRLQEAGGGIYSDGRDNSVLGTLEHPSYKDDELTRLEFAYHDYKHEQAVCGENYESFDGWLEQREAKDRRIKSSYEAYNKYVSTLGTYRSMGANVDTTKSYEEWVKVKEDTHLSDVIEQTRITISDPKTKLAEEKHVLIKPALKLAYKEYTQMVNDFFNKFGREISHVDFNTFVKHVPEEVLNRYVEQLHTRLR